MPYVTNEGVKIQDEVEGEGPPLVMLHGLFGNVADWYDFDYVNNLKDDYQLILIDQRGHGISDKPYESDKYLFKLFVDDIVAVMSSLAIDQFHVYGFSLGGQFTYGLAKYYPEKLLSIINADGSLDREPPHDLRDLMTSFDEKVESRQDISPAHKDRFLANDKTAINAIIERKVIENLETFNLANEVVKQFDIPYLVLTSNIDEEEDWVILLKKTASEIPNAKMITFEEFTHIELLIRSDMTLPIIEDFLATASKN
jgi:pimeloyl-ACP methyl ester carboxylesterase